MLRTKLTEENLRHLRSTEIDQPVSVSLVENLQELTADDVRKHPPFAFAPIIVMSNLERQRLNRVQVEAFAKAYGLLLIVWRMPLTDRYADAFDDNTFAQLYENEPGLWGYFARGAPAMLLRNIQATKCLVNGAMGHLHSLTFEDGEPNMIVEAQRVGGYQRVEIPTPPLSVNLQLELPDGDTGEGIESLVDGAVVVPILCDGPAAGTQEYETCSLFASMSNIPKCLRYSGPALTLAFALTDYKVQGASGGH
jgi:hypothetical protein